MYYVIFAQDVPGSLEKRLSVREQHLARLKQLQTEGRLLTAGPNPPLMMKIQANLALLARQ